MSQPAARLGDMHVCPMQTPAVVPIPHVGGPIISPGEPTVLIGGMPAARVGDLCICVGPPDTIIKGSMTVLIGGKPAARMGDSTAHGGSIVLGGPTCLIGDSGGGAGSPQAFTMSAAKAAGAPFTRMNCGAAGVLEAQSRSPVSTVVDPTKTGWIEIELVDQAGKPVPHERYRVTPPGGAKPIEGFLDEHGEARLAGIDPGTCVITFPDIDAASWAPEKGDPGRRTKPLPPSDEFEPSIDQGSIRLKTDPAGTPSIGPVTVRVSEDPGIGPVTAKIEDGPGIGAVRLTAVERPSIGVVSLRTIEPPGIGTVTIQNIPSRGR